MVFGVPREAPTVFLVEVENLVDDKTTIWSVCGTLNKAVKSALEAGDFCGEPIDEETIRKELSHVGSCMSFRINEVELL
jgi:hypothetical protein